MKRPTHFLQSKHINSSGLSLAILYFSQERVSVDPQNISWNRTINLLQRFTYPLKFFQSVVLIRHTLWPGNILDPWAVGANAPHPTWAWMKKLFAHCVIPGTWCSPRPVCPALGSVCASGRWFDPTLHRVSCSRSAQSQTPSYSGDAAALTLSLGTVLPKKHTIMIIILKLSLRALTLIRKI